MGFIHGVLFTRYGFNMWTICQGMGFMCGVFVKVWVLYEEYFSGCNIKTGKNMRISHKK